MGAGCKANAAGVREMPILLVLTLLLSFTGYLLPWDQLAIWAITDGFGGDNAGFTIGTAGLKLKQRRVHCRSNVEICCV